MNTVETKERWAESGAHEVAPHTFRIPLPLPDDGLRAVNVYALTSEDGVVLIDGGWAIEGAEDHLIRMLALLGHQPEDVRDIIVTHAHRDHYTLAVNLRKRWRSRISIGSHERESLEDLAVRAPYTDPRQVSMLQRAGASDLADAMREIETPFDKAQWELPDVWLDDRSVVELPRGRTLEVIHTPGHTTGHIVLLDRAEGLLFSGDHVLPHITPSLGYEEIPQAAPLADYLSSLNLLRAMPDTRMLPAHGPSTPSVHARVDALLEHHAERLELTLQVLAAGQLSPFEITQELRWTRRRKPLSALDPFNQALATLETVAHLTVLAQRGLVQGEDDTAGVVRYALAGNRAANLV
ncbi:MBL fold metallo-hydrolase [Georgenia yuyongxinii]|uniref:MBL fold metallo-hydrolase n=1 Tax=Georgenia yuyongxinii TaxID=2589797 RepID=A0A552WY93_9MICO|nr:MBL fold metallo-hydrolase [Georgenia yuyongxinii]TRW47646.1 MBL fold metallo-hydrolase [Georgenia yuyongxinii]